MERPVDVCTRQTPTDPQSEENCGAGTGRVSEPLASPPPVYTSSRLHAITGHTVWTLGGPSGQWSLLHTTIPDPEMFKRTPSTGDGK